MTDKFSPGPWELLEPLRVTEPYEIHHGDDLWIADIDCRNINDLLLASKSRQMYGCLVWLLHLANNVGKRGGPPEEGEWEAAWSEVGELLDELED